MSRAFPLAPKAMIGMLHVGALPGTPRHALPVDALIARAVEEATLLTRAGFDALLLENMHDAPYLNGTVGAEIVACMTAVGSAVRAASPLPLGVQILAAANCEALAVAQAIGAGFVRAENFVFAHVADEGLMPTASAGPLLRYRREIGAENIAIIADVKKKHASHAITADIPLAEAAAAAAFFGADGVVVTGTATGRPTELQDVRAVRAAVEIPVFIGSGIAPENLPGLWPHADAFIVGSYCKLDGRWSNPLDPQRVETLMHTARALRKAVHA